MNSVCRLLIALVLLIATGCSDSTAPSAWFAGTYDLVSVNDDPVPMGRSDPLLYKRYIGSTLTFSANGEYVRVARYHGSGEGEVLEYREELYWRIRGTWVEFMLKDVGNPSWWPGIRLDGDAAFLTFFTFPAHQYVAAELYERR